MATERVKCLIRAFDNFIEIVPDKGVKDNSVYEIRLKDVLDINGNEIASNEIKFATAMSPAYCTLMDVKSLIDDIDIPDDILLYNIREASRYAEYAFERTNIGKKININNIPFEIKQFVRYKAAKDCMMKIYMSLVSNNMIEGMLGEVKFKTRDKVPDIKNIMQYLDREILRWLDAIKGYHLEGRAKAKTAIRGYHHGGKNPMASAEKRVTPKGVPISLDRGVY